MKILKIGALILGFSATLATAVNFVTISKDKVFNMSGGDLKVPDGLYLRQGCYINHYWDMNKSQDLEAECYNTIGDAPTVSTIVQADQCGADGSGREIVNCGGILMCVKANAPWDVDPKKTGCLINLGFNEWNTNQMPTSFDPQDTYEPALAKLQKDIDE